MLRQARFAHLYVFSLLTGFLVIAEWSLIPAQRQLSAIAYVTLEQGMNDVLEWLTATFLVVSTVSAAVVVFLLRRQRGPTRTLAAIALACVVAMVVSTLIINAPVNFAIDQWNPASPPADWEDLRRRWELGHTLRSYVGLVGLGSALASALWRDT